MNDVLRTFQQTQRQFAPKNSKDPRLEPPLIVPAAPLEYVPRTGSRKKIVPPPQAKHLLIPFKPIIKMFDYVVKCYLQKIIHHKITNDSRHHTLRHGPTRPGKRQNNGLKGLHYVNKAQTRHDLRPSSPHHNLHHRTTKMLHCPSNPIKKNNRRHHQTLPPGQRPPALA